jgi:type IV pilus modification protein PilV
MKVKTNILTNQAGITIIEVMVAIIILSTGFLAVAKLQSVTLSSVYRAQKRSTAMLLAQAYLEAIPFNELDDWHGFSKKKSIIIDRNNYSVTTIVNPLGTATQKNVEITVSWDSHSLSFETLRFQ